jgi:hypothetical protein
MRDPQKYIRKAIIDKLQGNIMTEAGNVQGFQWKDVLLDWGAYANQYNKVVRARGYKPTIWSNQNVTWGNASFRYAVPLPIYHRIPNEAVLPYIRVYSLGYNEIDQNATLYNLDCRTRIEVVSAYYGDDGGETEVNDIVSEIVFLLRTRVPDYIDLTDFAFKVYTSTIESVDYLEIDEADSTYFKAVIELSNRIQKL